MCPAYASRIPVTPIPPPRVLAKRRDTCTDGGAAKGAAGDDSVVIAGVKREWSSRLACWLDPPPDLVWTWWYSVWCREP
jgi:hypothetical protein